MFFNCEKVIWWRKDLQLIWFILANTSPLKYGLIELRKDHFFTTVSTFPVTVSNLCSGIPMSVSMAEFVVTCARQPSTASLDRTQTVLSSCCVQGLEDWASTWRQQTPASSLTLTGTLRMTCRYEPHTAFRVVRWSWDCLLDAMTLPTADH